MICRTGRPDLPLVLALGSLLSCAPEATVDTKLVHTNDRVPHYHLRAHEAVYAGPGRDDASPVDARVIDIGWFGPVDDEDPLGGPMWRAAKLSIDDANAERTEAQPAFRLVARWSENPWGTGISDLARLVYEGRIVAIAGAPDGSSAHLVEQVAAKARIPFISTASTDKTVNLANVPWVFSCVPGDHQWSALLAGELHRRIGASRWLMVSFTDHDSRQASDELLKACVDHQLHPARHFTLAPGTADFREIADVLTGRPALLIVIGGAMDTGRALRELHEVAEGVLCGPHATREACASVEGMVVPVLWDSTSAGAAAFVEAYRRRYGCIPDYTAAYTYDGLRLLIDSVRRVGANRVLVRDAVRATGYTGVTGRIQWDPVGQNTADVRLGIIRESSLVPLAQEQ